jgi:serine/threonine protein kinase
VLFTRDPRSALEYRLVMAWSGILLLCGIVCNRCRFLHGMAELAYVEAPMEAQDPLVGTVVGGDRYRLLALIGRGGMGAIYEAEDLQLHRRVAIKALRAGTRDGLERFRQEAFATAQLGHPHVVPLLDFITDPEPYMVMELLVGQSLSARLAQEGPLSPTSACYVAMQVLSALEAAHARGIIHRDIKPSNIFLVKSPVTAHFAKVLDFGIAKILEHDGPPISHVGEMIGSAPYMSPEQIHGDTVDPRNV